MLLLLFLRLLFLDLAAGRRRVGGGTLSHFLGALRGVTPVPDVHEAIEEVPFNVLHLTDPRLRVCVNHVEDCHQAGAADVGEHGEGISCLVGLLGVCPDYILECARPTQIERRIRVDNLLRIGNVPPLLQVEAFHYLVELPPAAVVALQSVRVHQTGALPVYGHPPRALSGHALLVLLKHQFFSEVALLEIEIQRIHRDQLRVQH